MDKRAFRVSFSIVAAVLFHLFYCCSTSTDDKVPANRREAVLKLADQAQLAKMATEDEDLEIRETAIGRLTDQGLLAKVAMDSDESYAGVILAAVDKLSDQILLKKLAVEGKNPSVRLLSVKKLTDPDALAEIALADTSDNVRNAAISKLPDRPMISELANPIFRAKAIGELEDSDPRLWHIAGDLGKVADDARPCIARMKLATREPRIKSRFPRIRFASRVADAKGAYFQGSKPGEEVAMDLQQDDIILARGSWTTVFPLSTQSLGQFQSAIVSGGDLLKKLFQKSVFSQEDLMELARSRIPEVRIGALANIADPALLAKVANEDKEEWARLAARERLAKLGGAK